MATVGSTKNEEKKIASQSSTTTTSSSSNSEKKELTSAEKLIVANMAQQIWNTPETQKRKLTIAQVKQMAENIYRKKTGKGRRTYKKKLSKRKTRKVRSV